MDQVVAADRQGVAVAGDHPYGQVIAGDRQPGGDGGRAAVNRVQAVGLQVVREPARASDAADEHHVFAAQAQLRQEVANGVEDDVVAAAGAPADLLVSGEILRLLGLICARHATVLRQTSGQGKINSGQARNHVSHTSAPTPVCTVTAANRANLALSLSISRSVPSRAASMMPSTSSARNAMPATLVTGCTSMR